MSKKPQNKDLQPTMRKSVVGFFYVSHSVICTKNKQKIASADRRFGKRV